jgi:hypothetical protein
MMMGEADPVNGWTQTEADRTTGLVRARQAEARKKAGLERARLEVLAT